MNVRRQAVRLIQCSDADKAHRVTCSGVVAPNRDAAVGTARDLLALAAVGRRIDHFDLALQQRHAISFDHGIERKRASGFTLAPAAMTAMNEQRLRRHAVAHRATGTSAFKGKRFVSVHKRLSRKAEGRAAKRVPLKRGEMMRHVAPKPDSGSPE